MRRVKEKEDKIRNDYMINQKKINSDLDMQLKLDSKYYKNMMTLFEKLGNYAVDEQEKGNIGPISRFIIYNTGVTGKMF